MWCLGSRWWRGGGVEGRFESGEGGKVRGLGLFVTGGGVRG